MDGRVMAENIKEYVCCSMQINGLPVEARYSRECVDQILIPLLLELTRMQKEKGSRVLALLRRRPVPERARFLPSWKSLRRSMRKSAESRPWEWTASTEETPTFCRIPW